MPAPPAGSDLQKPSRHWVRLLYQADRALRLVMKHEKGASPGEIVRLSPVAGYVIELSP